MSYYMLGVPNGWWNIRCWLVKLRVYRICSAIISVICSTSCQTLVPYNLVYLIIDVVIIITLIMYIFWNTKLLFFLLLRASIVKQQYQHDDVKGNPHTVVHHYCKHTMTKYCNLIGQISPWTSLGVRIIVVKSRAMVKWSPCYYSNMQWYYNQQPLIMWYFTQYCLGHHTWLIISRWKWPPHSFIIILTSSPG